ncbi:MAG: Mfa1 family fimbria major subunit, partial [Mucinivorans sp.]
MKQIKFFAMAFAALAMFSCAKDKMGDGENPPVVEGVETYATFNFQVDGNAPKSRAASETDAGKTTDKDDVVKDIRIAVFKVGTPSLLEATATVKVTAPGLTNTAIKLTSGQKRIFVFANSENTVGFPTLTIGTTTLETCYASLIDLDPTKASFSMADITSDAKGFFMSNARTAGSLKNLLPNITAAASQAGDETANHFTFTVQRAISKVNAKLTAGVAAGVAGGTLSDLFYTVRNINKQFRPVQTFLDVNITDAEAAGKTILPIAAFYNKFDGVSDADMEKPVTFTDYDRMANIDQPLTETKPTTAVFVTENTNARQVLGNTSYLAVKGKYTPTAVLASCAYENIGDGVFTPVAGTLDASGDFYKVDLAGLKKTGIGGK